MKNSAFRSFSEALSLIKSGNRVARIGWGNMKFIFLVPGSNFIVNRPPLLGIYPEGKEIHYLPHIDCCWSDNSISPWIPTQPDLLSNDWIVMND